ncbi:MAG: Hsp20/alpha crystallin family protein [Planctomycetes bacterium]|nr:Hsp20/alpha crystallin family protein [Planctomycetota bacterium]
MNLIPWRDRRTSKIFDNEMEEWMSRFFNDASSSHLPALFGEASLPPINVSETDKTWNVSVELPGLKEKDIQVQVIGQQLVISGERKWEEEKKNKEYHRVESQFGSFRRAVSMPSNLRLDPDGITASYTRGILEVSVPKLEPTPAKVIPVKAG